MSSWLEIKKNELSKDADKYRHELQVRFLKTELNVKQLATVYPILFAKFTTAQKEIGYLFGAFFVDKITGKVDWVERFNISTKAKTELNDFLMINLLFLSPDVKKIALNLDSKLDKVWTLCVEYKLYNNATLEDKKYLAEVTDTMRQLEQQMQLELSAASTD